MEMERNEWKIDISWNKAHAGMEGNELADRLAKEASISNNNECYNKIPKTTISKELKGQCIK
jgi:ribonuclease HI